MDLWDLTRLLLRRWYFALPILLVSVGAAFVVTQTVEPDYRSTGNVVLIPAPGDPADAVARDKGQSPPSRPKNPWLDLGFEALGSAATLKVMDQNTLKSFTERGLSDSVTVTVAQRNPIYTFEVVGASPGIATATVREAIRVFTAEVAAQQIQYNAMPQDTITTLTLTDGADVETVTSKVTRVVMVTIGLGLLLTAAGTIGLDVLIRRRRLRRRPSGARPVAGAVPAPRSGDDEPGITPRFVGSEETQQIPRLPRVRGEGGKLATVGATPSAGGRPANGRHGNHLNGNTVAATDGESRNAGRRSAAGGEASRRSDAQETIVLQVPNRQWSDEDDRTGR